MNSMLMNYAPATAERAAMRVRGVGSPMGVSATMRPAVLSGLSWAIYGADATVTLPIQGQHFGDAAKGWPVTESQACSVPNPAAEYRGVAPGTEAFAQKCDAHHARYIAAGRGVD